MVTYLEQSFFVLPLPCLIYDIFMNVVILNLKVTWKIDLYGKLITKENQNSKSNYVLIQRNSGKEIVTIR